MTKNHADDHGSNGVVLTASADAEGDVKWVEEHLDRPEGAIPAIRCQIGPVIGSHVGPGMVAVVFWGATAARRFPSPIASRTRLTVGSSR